METVSEEREKERNRNVDTPGQKEIVVGFGLAAQGRPGRRNARRSVLFVVILGVDLEKRKSAISIERINEKREIVAFPIYKSSDGIRLVLLCSSSLFLIPCWWRWC